MTINLWPDRALETEGNNAGCPSLTPYLLGGAAARPAVIVMPGGGYTRRAPHEGEPIARWLNTLGIASFVLNYRVAPSRYPAALEDARRAIRLVRHQADAWSLDRRRIGVLGFSAGGHVAASAGTRFTAGDPVADDPVERLSSRPDLLILCYPVITMGAAGHAGSRAALLGDREHDADLVALTSNERHVSRDTPPAFLWHTADDGSVPVENSQRFAAALAQQAVPFELHIFERGPHGLGLGHDHPGVQHWPALCAAWLAQRGFR